MSTTQDYLLRLIELRKVATAVPQDPGSQAMAAAAKINPMSGNATITPIETEKPQGPAQADLDKKDKEIQKLQSEAEAAKLELQKEKAKAELIKTHQQNLERSKAEREKLQKEKEKLKSDLEISKARMQQAESEHTTRMQNISAQQKVQMAEDRAKSMMSAADQNAKAYVKMTQDAAKDSNAFFADSQKALNAQHSALLKDKDALLKDKEKFVNDKLNRSSGLSPLLTRRLQNAAAATRNLAKLRSHLQGMSGVYMSKASAAPAPAQQQPAQQQPAPGPAPAPQQQQPAPGPAPAPQQQQPAPQQQPSPRPAPAAQQPAPQPAPGTTQLVNQQDRYNALRSKYTLGQNASLSDLARTQAALKREVEEGRLARQDVRGAQRYYDEVTARLNEARKQVNTAARKGDVDAVNQQRDYSALTYRPKGWFTTGRSALDDMSAVKYDPRVASQEAAQRATEGRAGKWWRVTKGLLEGLNPFPMIERAARNADMSRHIANTYDVDQNFLTGYSGANANRAAALADELKLKQSWGGNLYDQGVSLANAASYAIPGTGLANAAALGGGLLAANMATANGGYDDGSIMTTPTLAAQYGMHSKIASTNTPDGMTSFTPVQPAAPTKPAEAPTQPAAQPVTPKGMTSFTPVQPQQEHAAAPEHEAATTHTGTTRFDAPESSSAEGRRKVGEGGKWIAQEHNTGFPADTFYKSRMYMSYKDPATQLIRGAANALGMPILNGGTGNGTYAGNLGITSRLAAAMMRANDPYMLESTGIHGGPLAYGTTKDVSGHNAFLAQQWSQGGYTPVANTAWSDRPMA